ncbi:unnamed protein product [Linum tenue]|uniref:Uncharacterized protein n=1 Tax=Linum tenue TaxID=586396 RepID=A0AAV0S3T4_9ROSI|nr:unnamed protein product [Linum tenue]
MAAFPPTFSPPPSQVWTGTCSEQEEQSRAEQVVEFADIKPLSLPPHTFSFIYPTPPKFMLRNVLVL